MGKTQAVAAEGDVMFDKPTPDVLVVGAGPVGLYAALSLSKLDVPVQIVDTGMWPCAHSYALALHPQSLRLMQEHGLLDDVLERAYPVRRIGLYEGPVRKAEIKLGKEGDPTSRVAVLPQDALEGLLERALEKKGVAVQWRHEAAGLVDRGPNVSGLIHKYEKESGGYVVSHTEWVVAKTTPIEVPFVLGADGYNSGVRRSAGIDFPEVAPPLHFAVFEFYTDFDMEDELRVVFSDDTINVLWPLPDGYCRWGFQLRKYTDPVVDRWADYRKTYGMPSERRKDRLFLSGAGESPVLEDSNLEMFLHERARWFNGSIDDVRWRTLVRFEKRLATSFGSNRMWLAGDAAHLTAPIGVQSSNLGLLEAQDLTCAMKRVLKDGAPLGTLTSVGDRWMQIWRQLQGLDGGLHPTAEADSFLRDHADQLTSCLPAYGASLDHLASQIGLEL